MRLLAGIALLTLLAADPAPPATDPAPPATDPAKPTTDPAAPAADTAVPTTDPSSTPTAPFPAPAQRVRDISAEVERIRGLRFKHPVPMEVVDDAATRKHALDRVEKLQTREALDAELTAYRLLGLVPEGVNPLEQVLGALEEQVGGFYDPGRKTFFLLDDMPSGIAPALIAHELTHALEDQIYDLDARIRATDRDGDRQFAVSAVHEGSATLVMTLYAARALREGRMKAADFQAFAETDAGKGAKLAELPAVLHRQLVGTYVLGANFLTRGRGAGIDRFPGADVKRAFRQGPRSSEQILHPEKFWEVRDEPLAVALGSAGTRLGEGWSRASDGTLGELIVAVLTGAPTPGDFATAWGVGASGWTNAAASGWGGDRWELWRRGSDAALLYGSAWDTERDAKEFAAALGTGPTFAFRQRGRAVAIVAGLPSDGAGTGDLLDAVLDGAFRKR